jgi:hypothetical protein
MTTWIDVIDRHGLRWRIDPATIGAVRIRPERYVVVFAGLASIELSWADAGPILDHVGYLPHSRKAGTTRLQEGGKT